MRASASGLVSLAGEQLLVETARVSGLGTALSAGLALWWARSAIHDPGTVLLHLAFGLAAGGDCPPALGSLRAARGAAQARLMLTRPDGEDSEVVVDVDATLITAHSDKQGAAPTYKRGHGFHPLLAYPHHDPGGTGMPLAGMLRPGKSRSPCGARTGRPGTG